MNRLAKLIDAYNQGKISLDRLEQELDFQDWQERTEQGRNKHFLVKTIRNNMYNSLDMLCTKTPEEIVLEMERQKEICESLESIHEIIGDRDYNILMCYVVDRMTHKAISKKYNIARTTVTMILKNIPERVKKYANKYPDYANALCKENLLSSQSMLEADTPKVNGYPHEFLQHISIPGEWKTFKGRRNYRQKSTCLLPEYFEGAFGDKETVCTLCNECRRKK